MDMVEKVARAICRAGVGELVFESWDAEMQVCFLRQARAAIEAMREPTEAQIATGLTFANWPHDGSHNDLIRSCYSAMIAAALSPSGEK